jgi:ADP-ribosyl-[dinitrogen reductase] hydrolase
MGLSVIMNSTLIDSVKGCLVGLACGDAVGTTVEFRPRGGFKTMTDMVGGGPFKLEKGQWTDDTTMALCLAQSLLHQKQFDPIDQMNRYCDWYQRGYLSTTGTCFDIGRTTAFALRRYLATQNPYSGPTDRYSAGNGSLMRLAPIPIFYQSQPDKALYFAGESSKTTHGADECIDSCQLFCALILSAFKRLPKQQLWEDMSYTPYTERVKVLSKADFVNKDYEALTGSGYVIESLESALWCFFNADSYKEAILLAVNIGNDADTTAAICGQIAGAYYGYTTIPTNWRTQITLAKEIEQMAVDLYYAGAATQSLN